MKKLLFILLSAVILLVASCNTWMQDDDFYSDIENDVKVANAKQISVYVRYAMTRQGKTDPDGPATFKVEIPHEISATTEPEYGFVRWAAFSTSFLATGDNQSKNKDIYFIDEEDYNKRILPNEIQSPDVVFEDATKATTTVKVNVARDDIFLCPIVAQRPVISLTIPAKGSSGVVRNMSVRINFSKPMDPASFKNAEGVYDKITVTQGIQSFSADGDIEITSEDISDRFEPPVFSKNKKMITLKFKPEAISEGYSSQSSVNITISKDVKDIYGFSMTDDDKISFSVGSYMDTLAPRITQLTAGRGATDFANIKGMYKDAATWNNIQAYTKMEAHQQSDGSYLGASSAPADLNATFYDSLVANRVTNKVIIRVFAEDIAGSGTGQDQTGIETDVAMIGIKAYHLNNADGTPDGTATELSSINYVPQTNIATSIPGAYKSLVDAVNATIPGTENDLANNKGCLFEYDLSSLPDGLIRIDVAAVDMVQNSGLSDGGAYSEEYGNGYASLFVIKDTTRPNALNNANYAQPDTDGASEDGQFFNYNNYVTQVKIKGDTSSIYDEGHPRLRSPHDLMKWIVRPTADTTWIEGVSSSSSEWRPVTSDYSPFPRPNNEGEVHYTFALMDDMGNISTAVGIPAINYDSVAPVVQNLSLVADEGYTAGTARGNVLDHQTLVIPVTEETSGVKKIEVHIRKDGATEDYATPFAAGTSGLTVTAGGTSIPFTVSGKTLTFTNRQPNFDSNITIKGLKISDATSDAALQGGYSINVTVSDDAGNPTNTSEVQGLATSVSIDSVAPVINKIYIPNIKQTVRFNGTTPEWWIDYNAAPINTSGTTPRTEVYVKFTEASSGAKIFDFAGSSIHLTAESQIFQINPTTAATTSEAIACTVDTANNRLIINSSTQSSQYFGVLADPNTSIRAAKITNVELAPAPASSTVALKIHDVATNVAATASSQISSKEGSVDFASEPSPITTTNFSYDPATPSSSTPHGSLADRETEITDISVALDAELGWTNNAHIKATVDLTPSAAGIDSLTIIGDAIFDTTSATPTTISVGSSSAYFDVSADGKTIVFKVSPTDPSHTVLGTGSTPLSILIDNLFLTGTDGLKSVTFKARSFGCLTDPTGSSDTITLDTTAPVWVETAANHQFYSGTDPVSPASTPAEATYPHPISGGKAYGISFGGTDTNLYFYTSVGTSQSYTIYPNYDPNDATLKDEGLRVSFSPTGSSTSTGSWFTRTGDVTNTTVTCYIRDRAGNKSIPQTFRVIKDDVFASPADEASIDNYMTLSIPTGSQIHRNSAATQTGYLNSDIYNGGAATTAARQAINYVIKGAAATDANTAYEIKIKLASGVQPTDTDKLLDGSNPTTQAAYNRRLVTTNSSPIEYFAVSHWYASSDTTGYTPVDPVTISKGSWNLYTASSPDYTNGDITSYVDANGNIIIKVLNKNCPPLTLYLKDACGNITYRKIKPTSMTGDLAWVVDTGIGLSGQAAFGQSYTSSTTGSIKLPLGQSSADTNFYTSGAKITITGCSDSCFFEGTSGEVTDATEIANNSFTLKSRVIMWSGTETPTLENFNTPALSASGWKYYRKASEDAATPTFSMEHSLPYSSVLPTSKAAPYTLWLVLVDTVGNYEAKALKWTSNAYSSKTQYWCYDVTNPAATAGTPTKVNNIDNKNYYSSNSSVPYTISDYQSGLRYNGSSNITWTSFENRTASLSETYYLSTQVPKAANGTSLGTTATSGYLPLPYIRDFADNTRPGTNGTSGAVYPSGSTPVGLEWQSTSQWVRQADAPVWKTRNENVTVTSPDDGTESTTTVQRYYIDAVNGSNATTHLWPTLSNDTPADDTSTIDYKIKSGRDNGTIKVNLRVESNNWNGLKEPLLGFIITTSEKSASSFQTFYSTNDFTDTSYGTYNIHTTTNDSRLSYNSPTSDTYYTYTYTFTKTDTDKAWHTEEPNAYYFYPVSRSGLVCKKPVKVYFDKNPVPSITEGSISYSGVKHYGEIATEDKHISVGSTNNVNYTKSGSTISFKVDSDSAAPSWQPTHCKISWGTGSNSRIFALEDYKDTGWSTSSSNLVYKIPLTGYSDLNGLENKSLKLQVYTEETINSTQTTVESSNEYDLNGPAGNNMWTCDGASPTITFSSSTIKSVNYPSTGTNTTAPTSNTTSNNIKYIQSPTVRIEASASDNRAGIERYQWRSRTCTISSSGLSAPSYGGWTDIPTSYRTSITSSSAVFEFPAEENITQYEFRVIDKASNVSATSSYSSSSTATYNTVMLQRDEWAPAVPATENGGLIAYKLYNGTTEKTALTGTSGNSLITESGSGNSAAVEIKYSSNSSAGSDNYINKIVFDFSKVTDNVDADGNASLTGIQRSGFDISDSTNGSDIMVKIGNNSPISIDRLATSTGFAFDSSTKLLTLSLPADSNTTQTYAFTVKDNIGNSRTLRTFTLKPDGLAPVLSGMTIYANEAKTIPAVNEDSDAVSHSTWYLKGDKAVVQFNITDSYVTDPRGYYYWGDSGIYTSYTNVSEWHNSDHTEVTSSSTTITYTLDAPETKKYYQFMAKDEVGNTVKNLYKKLVHDEWAPTGTLGYSTNYGSTERNLEEAGINTELDTNSRLIKYSSTASSPYFINKIDLNLNPITDKVSNTERAGIKYFQVITESSTDLAFTSPTQVSDIKIWDRTSGYDLPTTAGANDIRIDSSRHYQLDLSDNVVGTYYRYTIKVYDNISYNTTLYTFITQSDNQPPAFPQPAEADIQATEEDGTNSSNSVKYNGIFYLKNDRAVVSFTQSDESDANAHYRWSNDNSHWYEYDATSALWKQYELNTSTNTYVESSPAVTLPGSTASITRDTTNHKVTFSFAAPDTPAIYYFMAEDLVGNRMIRGASSDNTNCIKLQKDKWAPDGTVTYDISNGSGSQKDNLTTNSLISETGSGETAAVEITYSSNASANSPYYASSMEIDLSAITDNVESIPRSGIDDFLVSIDNGSTWSSISGLGSDHDYNSSTKKLTITLPDDSSTQKTYIIKVKDHIGQERILKTFTLKPDGAAPTLALASGDSKVQKSAAADGSSPANAVAKDVTGATDNGTYYLNTDYAVINLTKTFSGTGDLTYWVNDGTGYTQITSGLTDNSGNITYVFATPETATTYKFKAKSAILNESAETDAITIQKDAAITALSIDSASINWSFKKDDGTSAIANTFYNITTDETTSKTITYNGNQINKLELDVSSYAALTEISGIRRYWLNVDGVEVSSLEASTPAFADNKWPVGIAETGTTEKVIKLRAEDWAGNITDYIEFRLTPDAVEPNLTLTYVATQGDGDEYIVTKYPADDTGVYYLKNNFAVVKLATTTSGDITKYVWFNSSATTPVDLTLSDAENLKHKFDASAVTTATEYTIKAVDAVGNESDPVTIKIAQDQTPPAGTVTYTVNKDSTEASTGTPVGDYNFTHDISTATTTITYNPNKVNNIVFTPNITDEGSGYAGLYRKVTGSDDTLITDNTITLTDTMNGETYVVVAKDYAGNELAVSTYVFTADGTAPALASSKITPDGTINKIHSYTARKLNSEGTGYEDLDSIPYAKVPAIGGKGKSNYFASGTQIMYAKTDITGAVQYQIVNTVTTTDADGYNASPDDDHWQPMSDGTSDNSGANYVFSLPDIDTVHTRLALFFRDPVGNVSAPYYIGNKSDAGIQWWIIPTEVNASNMRVSNVYVKGNTSQVGWQAGAKQDYIVSINLPMRALITSITLSPDTGVQNTGVVIATGSSSNPFKDQILFTGFDPQNKKIESFGSEPYINVTESTSVGLTLTIYVWDKKDSSNNMTQSDPKVIINGFELELFPEGGYGNFTNGDGHLASNDISSISDRRVKNSDNDSRITQFFETIQNVFTSEPEVYTDNSPIEKPVKTSKKSNKTAKKSKKQSSKKASEKAASTDSTISIPAAPLAPAEIVEETVTSSLPEIAATTESVVNEIAGVSESSPVVQEVSTSSTEVQASVPEEKKSPSKSASIVIMLSILSSIGVVLYLNKSRKK